MHAKRHIFVTQREEKFGYPQKRLPEIRKPLFETVRL